MTASYRVKHPLSLCANGVFSRYLFMRNKVLFHTETCALVVMKTILKERKREIERETKKEREQELRNDPNAFLIKG